MAIAPSSSTPMQSDAPAVAPSSGYPARSTSSSYGQARGRGGADRTAATSEMVAFIPLLLLSVAVMIGLVFQCWQLVAESGQLTDAFASQVKVVDNATQFRAKLDKVARETQLLADKGNPNAKLVVDELRKRGITINPTATASPPAPATR